MLFRKSANASSAVFVPRTISCSPEVMPVAKASAKGWAAARVRCTGAVLLLPGQAGAGLSMRSMSLSLKLLFGSPESGKFLLNGEEFAGKISFCTQQCQFVLRGGHQLIDCGLARLVKQERVVAFRPGSTLNIELILQNLKDFLVIGNV